MGHTLSQRPTQCRPSLLSDLRQLPPSLWGLGRDPSSPHASSEGGSWHRALDSKMWSLCRALGLGGGNGVDEAGGAEKPSDRGMGVNPRRGPLSPRFDLSPPAETMTKVSLGRWPVSQKFQLEPELCCPRCSSPTDSGFHLRKCRPCCLSQMSGRDLGSTLHPAPSTCSLVSGLCVLLFPPL